MSRCSCVFCTTPATSHLPVPVLIVRTSDQLSLWVWVVDADPLELQLSGHCRSFSSFADAAHFAWSRLMGISSTSDVKILIKTAVGAAQWQSVSHTFGQQRRSIPSSSSSSSCICIQLATPPMRSASTVHVATSSRHSIIHPTTPATTTTTNEAAALSTTTTTTKRARKCAAQTQPRASANVPRRPASSQLEEVCNVDHSFECKTAREDEGCGATQPALAYDLGDLGGDATEVSRIVECRSGWDAEVIEELIRWGARPKLLTVHAVYDGGAYVKVQCTFVHLDGTLVPNVWMPLEYLRMDYGECVRHLK